MQGEDSWAWRGPQGGGVVDRGPLTLLAGQGGEGHGADPGTLPRALATPH